MKSSIRGVAISVASMLLMLSNAALAGAPPVAKLVQVQGDVQYSRNGNTWRAVSGTKYLFAGYQIKTGKDGSGKLIDEQTHESQKLGANSRIKVGEKDILVLEGLLSKPREESTSLFQSLANKFASRRKRCRGRRTSRSRMAQCLP